MLVFASQLISLTGGHVDVHWQREEERNAQAREDRIRRLAPVFGMQRKEGWNMSDK